MVDAPTNGEKYHFVWLMKITASYITLEFGLQTHPNIREETVAKLKLKNEMDYISGIICKCA